MNTDVFDLRTVILKILSRSPKHGYQLAKDIQKELQWKPSLGGIYPVLEELEKNGFILGHEIVEHGRFKKIYSVTPKGKEELEKVNKRFDKFKRFMDK